MMQLFLLNKWKFPSEFSICSAETIASNVLPPLLVVLSFPVVLMPVVEALAEEEAVCIPDAAEEELEVAADVLPTSVVSTPVVPVCKEVIPTPR